MKAGDRAVIRVSKESLNTILDASNLPEDCIAYMATDGMEVLLVEEACYWMEPNWIVQGADDFFSFYSIPERDLIALV